MVIEEDIDKFKKMVKKTIKTIKKLLGPLLKIILLIAIIVAILGAAGYYIFLDEGVWDESKKEKGRPSTAIKTAKMTPDTGITMNLENVVREGLKSLNYSDEKIEELLEEEHDKDILDIFEIRKKLRKPLLDTWRELSEAELLWCISPEYEKYIENPEKLDYLMKAELVTQYPKIDGLSSDKLNGVVEFKRFKKTPTTSTGEGEEVMLKFISEDEFNQKYQAFYQDIQQDDVLNYFTMDEEQNVIIATWTNDHGEFESNNTYQQESVRKKIKAGNTEESIQGEYDIDYKVTTDELNLIKAKYDRIIPVRTKVNYKEIVKKYTLPFEYLWSLLVSGESYNFVAKLASLSYGATIQLAVYDNIRINPIRRTKEFTEEFEEKTVITTGRSRRDGEWHTSEGPHSYYETETVTIIYNYTQVDILYVDCWIVEAEALYENEETQGEISENSTSGDGDSGWKEEIDSQESYSYERDDGTTGTRTITKWKRERTTGTRYTTAQNTDENKYRKVGDTVITPKVTVEGEPDNFVEFLRNDTKAFVLLSNKGTERWLVAILENNQDTYNMVDLTRYLLAKARNPDFSDEQLGISFDFTSSFTPSNLNQANIFYGNTVAEKIWCALINSGFSETAAAAALGNMDYESGGLNTSAIEGGSGEGYGLCQWSFTRKTQYFTYVQYKGVDPSDLDTQIEFFLAELGVESPAKDFADNQWLNKSRYNTWKTSNNIEEAAEAFSRGFERPNRSKENLAERINRSQSYYSLYQGTDMIYTNIQIGDIPLTGEDAQTMQKMLSEALRIAGDDRYQYSQALRNDEYHYDCSSLVQRLYKRFFGIDVPATTAQYGSQYYVGEFGRVNLQPGDILWRSGHVVIYIGGDTAVSASTDRASIPDQIRTITIRNNSKFSRVYRIIT